MPKGKKILVIEDDKFLRKVYESKLPKEGFEVASASNGKQGIELMIKEKPDLVLLDLIMPIKSGFEVLAEVKQNKALSKIPIIVLSNLGQDEDIDRAKKLGAKDFLVKSNMSIKEVIDKIHARVK